MAIDWVVFDLGRVVIDVDFQNFFRALPQEHAERARARHAEIAAALHEYEILMGGLSHETLHKKLRAIIAEDLSEAQMIAAVVSVLGSEKQDVCSAIEKLSARCAVACLSNTNHLHWNVLTTKYPVFSHFKVQMASHLLECVKPEPAIYQRAVELLKTTPDKVLFFDDKVENIEAASAAGWHAHLFTNYDQFANDLERYGLLS